MRVLKTRNGILGIQTFSNPWPVYLYAKCHQQIQTKHLIFIHRYLFIYFLHLGTMLSSCRAFYAYLLKFHTPWNRTLCPKIPCWFMSSVFQLMSEHFKQLCAQCSVAYLFPALMLVITVNVICVPIYVCVVPLLGACISPQQPVPHILVPHIWTDSTLLSNSCPPWPVSVCITSRAQSIFKQAMRRPLILFHVVSASMKRQYEQFLTQSELSPPQLNRVRFSQGSQHSGDRSSVVGGSIFGSGPQLGLNNT